MVDTFTTVNSGITNYFKSFNFLNIIGWIFAIILLVGGGWYVWIYYKNKKLYNKKIEINDIVGNQFIPVAYDVAKPIKLGSGGFEIIYLKKLRTWKIAFGGRVGKNMYKFFIMPDGYWYSGVLSADLKSIDANGGMIQVITTNPNMRGQYTSLEKQIDSLHQKKVSFWDKYGSWVLSLGFLLIAGFMLWLNYKEYATAMGSLGNFVDKLGIIADKLGGTAGSASNLRPV